jgi:hypothetical protein
MLLCGWSNQPGQTSSKTDQFKIGQLKNTPVQARIIKVKSIGGEHENVFSHEQSWSTQTEIHGKFWNSIRFAKVALYDTSQ